MSDDLEMRLAQAIFSGFDGNYHPSEKLVYSIRDAVIAELGSELTLQYQRGYTKGYEDALHRINELEGRR